MSLLIREHILIPGRQFVVRGNRYEIDSQTIGRPWHSGPVIGCHIKGLDDKTQGWKTTEEMESLINRGELEFIDDSKKTA